MNLQIYNLRLSICSLYMKNKLLPERKCRAMSMFASDDENACEVRLNCARIRDGKRKTIARLYDADYCGYVYFEICHVLSDNIPTCHLDVAHVIVKANCHYL